MINAVILAGGKRRRKKEEEGILDFGKEKVIIEALKKTKNINDIVTVGNRRVLEEKLKGCNITQERGSFIQNITTGYEYFKNTGKDTDLLFYAFGDFFPSVESIDDTIVKSDKTADLNLYVVDIEKIKERYPGYKKWYPYQGFEGFGFRWGNCFLVNMENVLRKDEKKSKIKIFDEAYAARRPDEIRSLIKFLVLTIPYYIPLLCKTLKNKQKRKEFYRKLPRGFCFNADFGYVEDILYKKTNLNIRIIKSDYAELAVDIDKASDKKYLT